MQLHRQFGMVRRVLQPLHWLFVKRFPDVGTRVFVACDGTVAAGSFAGMRYVSRAIGSALAPKILGSFEKEIRRRRRCSTLWQHATVWSNGSISAANSRRRHS